MAEYIDRQQAIDAIKRWDQQKLYLPADFREMLEEIPTADVRPVVRGEWVKNEDKAGWHCSACKEVDNYAFSWNSDTGKDEFQDNFCPFCGADMRGGDAG